MAAAHADVAHLAALDDIVQRLHGLLDGRVGVKAMTLEYIDIVEPKAAKRVVHALKNMLA